MSLSYLKITKGQLAPLFYLLIHAILLYGFSITCPDINNIHEHKYLILFWASAAISAILFFVVRFKDPGFVPYDGVFFTEEEPPSAISHNMNKYDSMFKLRVADSRIMSRGLDFSPSFVENQGKKDMLFIGKNSTDKSKFSKSTMGSTSMTKFANNTVNSPKISKMRDAIDSGLSNYVDGGDCEDNQMPAGAVLSNYDDDDDVPVDEVLDCQITSNCDEDNRQSYEMCNDDPPEMKRGPSLSPKNSKVKSKTPTPTKSSAYKIKYDLQLDDVTEEPEAEVKNTDFKNSERNKIDVLQTQAMCSASARGRGQADHENKLNIRASASLQKIPDTNGDNEKNMPNINRKESPVKSNHQSVVEQQDASRNKRVNASSDNIIGKGVHMNDTNQMQNKFDISIAEVHNMSNSMLRVQASITQSKNIDLEAGKSRNAIDQSVVQGKSDSIQQNPEQFETLYVERRYCTVCSLEQPLRSKHCKDCKKCIGQYDHHCPWLGTCIGEKNHVFFYYFIIFQFMELTWGEISLIKNAIARHKEEWLQSDIARGLVLISTTFFFIMVGSLFVLHTYLATQNLTTWEFLSWNKISYLKEWNPSWGSPFYQGFLNNIFFFCKIKTEISRWRMPKFKAPLYAQPAIKN